MSHRDTVADMERKGRDLERVVLAEAVRCHLEDRLPQAGAEEASVAPQAAASKEPMKERPSGVDWAEVLRRTFDFDVFVCVRCGGQRRGLAFLTALP